jgi:hypothetical protein
VGWMLSLKIVDSGVLPRSYRKRGSGGGERERGVRLIEQ